MAPGLNRWHEMAVSRILYKIWSQLNTDNRDRTNVGGSPLFFNNINKWNFVGKGYEYVFSRIWKHAMFSYQTIS